MSQIKSIDRNNIDKWFVEKVSGKDTNRPELQSMLEYIEKEIRYIFTILIG